MAFVVDKTVYDMFPGLLLVVCSGRNLDNETEKPNIQQALKNVQIQLRNSWEYANPQSHPKIEAWRRAFKQIGVSGQKFPSSIEAFCRRILSGREIPSINPLVNFYNLISIRNLVTSGGWDIDNIHGENIFLKLTTGGEPFIELGQKIPIYVEAGEVSYTDAKELITRHIVWRQSETAKIVTTTKNFFLVAEILPDVGREVAEFVEKSFIDGIEEYFNIKVKSAILDIQCLRWEWD
ncbi:B3/4 domain-containing protein [Nostoc sp. PA-18-2419]|uniref:B3/B4 domain-containing protein n=1 Tax=Nostoc sp. PA-18-2419 TaxID=2575443 RepID=UPI0011091A6A|nr:phenylalanine--tRNA ligase beta subunit-related protein [Nostoc sp. PA-18-2419]